MRRTTCLLLVALASGSAALAAPTRFFVNKLAADQAGVAVSTDADLVGAWGIAASATSPFWLAANGTGKSVVYDGAGVKQGLVVAISGDGSVTGVAFNGFGGFNGDLFLFVSEDGTVSGWRGALGTTAEILVSPNPANVYKSIAVATLGGHTYAYLANFRAGQVDVLKGDALAPSLAGNFTDPGLPSGYAPFDVQDLGGVLYVTYAQQDGAQFDPVTGAGLGFVDRFDLNGVFLGRLISQGALDAPWGLALAPAGFSDVAGDLLVGNFGDGRIHAYDPTTGALVETLQDQVGNPIAIDGLLGLRFGNGGNGGSASTLYFTASPGAHGLFGNLVPAGASLATVPTLDPAGLVVLAILLGLSASVLLRRRARKAAR